MWESGIAAGFAEGFWPVVVAARAEHAGELREDGNGAVEGALRKSKDRETGLLVRGTNLQVQGVERCCQRTKVKRVPGDIGHFYERLLSPARDSLAPAHSALRAFAAAANS